MSYKLCEPFPPIFLTTSLTPHKPYSLFVWPHISNCRKAKINERQTYRPPSYEHFQSDYLTTPFIQFVNFGQFLLCFSPHSFINFNKKCQPNKSPVGFMLLRRMSGSGYRLAHTFILQRTHIFHIKVNKYTATLPASLVLRRVSCTAVFISLSMSVFSHFVWLPLMLDGQPLMQLGRKMVYKRENKRRERYVLFLFNVRFDQLQNILLTITEFQVNSEKQILSCTKE